MTDARTPQPEALEKFVDDIALDFVQNNRCSIGTDSKEYRALVDKLQAAYERGRLEGLEEAAKVVEKFKHHCDGVEDQIKRYIAQAIRSLGRKG